MATEPNDSLLTLTALVDGELPPSARAAAAARLASDPDFAHAHAVLARLKAQVADTGGETTDLVLPRARGSVWRPAALIGLAGLAALAVGWASWPTPEGATSEPLRIAATSVGFPVRPVMPALEGAGLKLVDVAFDPAPNAPAVTATYRGPRGCRLELVARPASAAAIVQRGPGRYGWLVGDIAYQLVAFGMPEARFAIIASAAERATRGGLPPGPGDRPLREARVASAPCTG
jgi:hypothetical protein